MDENNKEDADSTYLNKLKEIASEIRESWMKDLDKTEYMKELTNIIKEILTKESIEEYFSNDEKALPYFMGDFMKEVLENIFKQQTIIGENGDEIALDLLLHIFKLFLKFHKNPNYSPLFEAIRYIFNENGAKYFFENHRYEDDEKNFNFLNFNSKFCSDFIKLGTKFNIGDEVDFLKKNNLSKPIEAYSWIRGKITQIIEDHYVIESFEDDKIIKSMNDLDICKVNTKTKDWDWRQNLKKYDVIDCFDRSKWYPATIEEVYERESNGYKNIQYRVAFRLFPEHFKNPYDESDTYDKHINIWKNPGNSEVEIKEDDNKQKYVGDPDNFSETLEFHSQRIQKFNTFTACQQKYLKDKDKHTSNKVTFIK